MFPILLIAMGAVVLLFGQRLSVLGAAVGALLGAVLLRLLPDISELWIQLAVVIGLALVGFFAAAFARGIIEIIILVLGALAGAAIVLALLDLLRIDLGLANWLLAVAGGVAGLILIRRSRRTPPDWGMIILASLVGALLITRGLTQLLPSLQGAIGTLLVVVLAGVSIAYQGGLLTGRKAAPPASTASGGGSQIPKDGPPPPPSTE